MKKILFTLTTMLAAPSALSVNYGILYLDITRSMETSREEGSSRCAISKSIAKTSVTAFFEKWNGRLIDVRTFSESGKVISLTGGFTKIAQPALDGIDSLTVDECPGKATALAEALCIAAEDIRNAVGEKIRPGRDHMMVVAATDGGENGSNGPCSGENWQEFQGIGKIEPVSPLFLITEARQ